MAFAMRRAGTPENAVGYDFGVSAVYLSDSGRSCQALQSGSYNQRSGARRPREKSGRVLLYVFERRLSKDCSGKSGAAETVWAATVFAGD